MTNKPEMPKWHDKNGAPISCKEKIKVMAENMDELYQTAQDSFEDALLMGCDEAQLRAYFQQLMSALVNPYHK